MKNSFPTQRQLEVLAEVRDLASDRGPTTADVAKAMKVTERGSRVQLESLRKKGLVEKSQIRHSKSMRWEVTAQGVSWLDAL